MIIRRFLVTALFMLLCVAGSVSAEPVGAPPEAAADIVQRIQRELSGPLTDDSKPVPGVPHGEFIEGAITDSKIYPGTENKFRVYVPAQYIPAQPACLLIRLDGLGVNEPTVFDNLIAKGDMPVTVAVGLSSGAVWKTRGSAAYRWNRSYEFDSTNGNFPSFVLDELLPRVETLLTKDGRPIRLSHEAKDRAAMGASTGGIGSFTLAWERPDSFSRVYSEIGTFVSMRGGNDYPALIRKTEPKAIRVFLEDGSTDAWNPLFGSWFAANENMEAALEFSGYDVQHAWGTHGHDGRPGNVILPDVMRWLWKGWPAPVQAGQSRNDMLASILLPGKGWQRVPGAYASAAGLASNPRGEVYFSDAKSHILYRIGAGGNPEVFSPDTPDTSGEAFGPDGTRYATVPATKEVIAFDAQGTTRKIAGDIKGDRILVTSAGEIYVTEPGGHSDEQGNVWRLEPGGGRILLNHDLLSESGVAFSPDHTLLFAAERAGDRVYSFVSAADGSLQDEEPFYWLHPSGRPDAGGTEDIAVDLHGDLYAATPLGIQVCDRNGRVRAILWMPAPCGPVHGLCWGGGNFDTLYATDGTTLFRRSLRIPGYPQWSAPVALPKSDAG
jgi:enterochelin esterase-like enzyme